MIPMDIKKAQFRIEHLSGCSTDSKRCVIFGIANISRYFEMARVKVRKLERNIKKRFQHKQEPSVFKTNQQVFRIDLDISFYKHYIP